MNEFEEKVVYEAIKDELKKFRNNSLYRCPNCETIVEWNDANYNPEESTYTCPVCWQSFDENESQSVTFIDYIQETYLAYQREHSQI